VEWNVPQATADSLASIMFVGMLVGALLWGIFTDHYGRRAGWLITTSITAVGGVLSAGAPDGGIFIFLGLRALVGLGLSGTNLGFALCSELLPRRSRGPLLMWFELFFVAGSVVEVLLVWLLLRRPAGWRWVLLLSTLPLWLALGLARRVPESPRWLTTRGKSASAAALLRHAAITNGQPPPLGPAEALAVAASCYTGAPSEPCDEDGGAHDGAPVPRVSERCEPHGCARYRCRRRYRRARGYRISPVASAGLRCTVCGLVPAHVHLFWDDFRDAQAARNGASARRSRQRY
jgi:hypothetical protein